MDLQCTAVFQRVPEGYIAFVEEFPAPTPRGPLSKKPERTFAKPSPVIEANRRPRTRRHRRRGHHQRAAHRHGVKRRDRR